VKHEKNNMIKCDISLLYVEDELILRSVYEKILERKVRQVELAENGEEAYNMYLKNQYDLVITDIKMPIMNGLDLVRKIRKMNPSARIIMMSAYSESQYFQRAIEYGVKGFLLKPVENERLFQTIDEQAREILLERSVHIEEEKRKIAEASLLRNEKVLQTVSDVAEMILRYGLNDAVINDILAQLGQTTDVSRVYIFENFEINGEAFCKQTYEWTKKGISEQINNPDLQSIPLYNSSIDRWTKLLSNRIPISGLVKDFPDSEREILESQEIISVLVVPIFVHDAYFGLIGFDDCIEERSWSIIETNAIITAANILGAAYHRERIENELKKLNLELETRVYERTKELEIEIIEKNHAENLLRDSEEKYRLIFENANDGIFLSSNKKIQFINPKSYEISGYLPKMVIGKAFDEFIHPEYRELVVKNHFDRMAGLEVPESYDIQIITAIGKFKWVEIKSNLITWDGILSVLTFMTDIQTRKDVEYELRELNMHLEDRIQHELEQIAIQQDLLIQKNKLESLGELSAGISHEINQPLGGISFSLDNILNEIQSGELTNEYLKNKINFIFNDIERIQKIINHVRIFSRDNQDISYEIVEVNDVIQHSAALVTNHYLKNEISLVLELENNPLYIHGSPFQLEQVLLNMLSNSKFALEKKAENSNRFDKKIIIKTWHSNNSIYIELKDNGIGIKKHLLLKVFDPFFTTKNAIEGTGLGLSISYGIIKRMEGEITVESTENEFTRFLIRIPQQSTE
jgi:PAS domain S-box-containing protein